MTPSLASAQYVMSHHMTTCKCGKLTTKKFAKANGGHCKRCAKLAKFEKSVTDALSLSRAIDQDIADKHFVTVSKNGVNVGWMPFATVLARFDEFAFRGCPVHLL